MFVVNDKDLPITVAQKIIITTKPIENPIAMSLDKVVGGDGTCSMFSLTEIKEIADYLYVFYNTYKCDDTEDEEEE